ncbi:hypothetical protein [Legionella oakridgensis]|uniref:Uncharacterized protein n=2 Tax=Legionella oakridgensis TaxID=29423 RepID=W0B514_9GAMM|nr:hypothetical protein [Legionella oakridgensis]AHE65613.1 hypothetical protein Loa_00022 [Legionella oakridgensis ATCC 33761 = DSM 21215]KTD38293.1 hypothetical protein Loak_1969 [Legionella oakridgensis]STY15575.1 Uncharacterised protein [Legionella longbeachae]
MFGFFSNVARTVTVDTVRTVAGTAVGLAAYQAAGYVQKTVLLDQRSQELKLAKQNEEAKSEEDPNWNPNPFAVDLDVLPRPSSFRA